MRSFWNWLLLGGSVVVAVLGLELALRVRETVLQRRIDERREGAVAAQETLLRLHRRSPDPVLKYELNPGAVAERDGIEYRINAQGIRDDDDVLPKGPGQWRLLIIGDSVAFGLGVEGHRTFPSLIEQKLGKVTQVHVLNGSVLGYRTSQEVRLFERDGPGLDPDAVLVVFCLNDFDDFSGELPFFDRSDALPAGSFRRLPPRRLGGFTLPDALPIADRFLLFRKASHRLLRGDYYHWVGTDVKRREEVAEAIGRLARMLEARGIPGFLAISPVLVDDRPYPYTGINGFVSERATAEGLLVFDLGRRLGAKRLARLRLSADDVLHLNARGHAAVAHVLAAWLAPVAHEWARKRGRPMPRQDAGRMHREGHLVERRVGRPAASGGPPPSRWSALWRMCAAVVTQWMFTRELSRPARVALTTSFVLLLASSTARALPPGFQLTVVLGGLNQPTAIDFAADGRVFVAEKSGLIKVFDDLADTTPTIFADLRTNVHNFWDRGLLGFALHPQFPAVPGCTRSTRTTTCSVTRIPRRMDCATRSPPSSMRVDTRKADLFLVPAAKDLLGPLPPPPPNPLDHNVDHYKCYTVRVTRGTPRFVPTTVTVADQFTSPPVTYDVKAVKHLCTPVDKNGEGIKEPTRHLLCYRVKAGIGQPCT